jgi:NADP-dependent 3-hydroxy acid dehydrogenase YdfG
LKDSIVGKFAIVTGASRGIGLSTVEQLLGAGMKVAGWSRSKCPIVHEDFLPLTCDISDWEQVEKAYNICRERFGIPFALINNAGIGYNFLLEETPIDVWDKMFRTNVNGVFYCSKVVLKDMKKQEEGHIVNISSIAGNNGIEGMTGYCGTKHAVTGISHALYKEVRNNGIKVTCIYPGSVQTNFFDEFESINANENMMKSSDIASTIVHALQSDPNYHHVDIEVRPLRPLGKKKK